MDSPFFSIIIPTLNEEKYLPKLLTDLRAQSLRAFEVIVVDGNSSDRTQPLVKRFGRQDSRFRCIGTRRRNVSYQRNVGAANSKANWLLFLDADSRVDKSYLRQLAASIKHHAPDAWTCYAAPDTHMFSDRIFMGSQNVLYSLLSFFGNPFTWGACLGCSKSAFELVHGFDEKIHFMEDSQLAQKIVGTGLRFVVLTRPSFVFSMRRYTKYGKFNTMTRLLPHHLKAFLNQDYTVPKKIYPMRGGSDY